MEKIIVREKETGYSLGYVTRCGDLWEAVANNVGGIGLFRSVAQAEQAVRERIQKDWEEKNQL